MENVNLVLSYKIAGMPLGLLLLSFTVLLITFAIKRYAVKHTLRLLERFARKTETVLDDELIKTARKPIGWLVVIIGVWTAISVLQLPSEPYDFPNLISKTGRIVIIFILTWFFFQTMDTTTRALKAKADDPEHWMDTSLVPLIVISLKVFVGVLVVILIAQNLGYSVSGLVASLGIGGIAVALAAKDTLANFFGSLMLLTDRPFKIGHWIRAENGEFEGVVEEIGFRSTKIRTFEKTIQVIPNDKLANTVIENMDRRKDENINLRRVKMNIGLEYKTSADQMEKVVESIRELLATNQGVDQKLIMVHFTDFGDFSLNIFTYYYVNTTSWSEYLSIRQEINLKIMRRLKEMGLSIAFPSQSLYIETPIKTEKKK